MFCISGIVDGISADKKQILEIKTKRGLNHHQQTITPKERKQALAYMKMHNANSCLFVEVGPDGRVKKTEIKWDEREFDKEIVTKLNKFCSYARSLTEQGFKDLLAKHQIFK
jgi:hypothetical protein